MKMLPQRAVLRNGESVLIREIGPDDRRLLKAGFEKLSAQSRFFRFLGPHGNLSEAELDRFTQSNTHDHVAIGAASIGVEQDMPIGTARFVRIPDAPESAEFAITVVDSHQRLGLGSLLLSALAKIAHEQGIDALVGHVHRDNTGIQKLIEGAGGMRVSAQEEAEWRLALPLAPKPTLSRQPTQVAIQR